MADAVVLVHLARLAGKARRTVAVGQVAVNIVTEAAAAVLAVVGLAGHVQRLTVLPGIACKVTPAIPLKFPYFSSPPIDNLRVFITYVTRNQTGH